MRARFREWVSVAITVGGLTGIPFWVASQRDARVPEDRRVIYLTGVMKDGAWTTEMVTSLNYGLKSFEPSIVRIAENEKVLFRLTSADVSHGFSVPGLGLGPVTVAPGEILELAFDADTTGVFSYYCTTICGACHYFMRGFIYIGGVSPSIDQSFRDQIIACPHHAYPENAPLLLAELVGGLAVPGAGPDAVSSLISRGRALFLQKGCAMCHREAVQALGGEAGEVPAAISTVADDPRYCPYQRFLARYEPARLGARRGRLAELDTVGLRPPDVIPLGETGLTEEDVDALSTYLLTNFRWRPGP